MPDTIDALFAFIFAGAAVWTLVPATESLARRIGDRAIDYPNERSLHEFPTPKLGGLAVLVAVLIGGSIFLPWDQETRSILAGAIVITAVGVIDDLVDLPAGVKLLGQTGGGDHPGRLGRDRRQLHPAVPRPGRSRLRSALRPAGIGAIDLGQVLTVFGIVAVANVINLIDGVDGLAAGVCLISAAALAVIALSLDRNAAGVLAAVTAGASLGFLRHGFPPASSFMGDTGSQPARLPDGGDHRPGRPEDQRGRRPLLPAGDPRRADPRHRLRGRQAAQVQPADLPRRHRALPPPHGRIGFSQRRTIAYLYGWTLVLPALRWPCASSRTPTTTATSTPSGRPSWRSACWARWPRAST